MLGNQQVRFGGGQTKKEQSMPPRRLATHFRCDQSRRAIEETQHISTNDAYHQEMAQSWSGR